MYNGTSFGHFFGENFPGFLSPGNKEEMAGVNQGTEAGHQALGPEICRHYIGHQTLFPERLGRGHADGCQFTGSQGPDILAAAKEPVKKGINPVGTGENGPVISI